MRGKGPDSRGSAKYRSVGMSSVESSTASESRLELRYEILHLLGKYPIFQYTPADGMLEVLSTVISVSEIHYPFDWRDR